MYYNTACALALAGDKEKAFQFLDSAIQAGFRNVTHLTYDVDLNSLHNDQRWDKAVAACELARARFIKEHSDPDHTRFITVDIDLFWKAYDKAMAAPPRNASRFFSAASH